MTPSRLLALSLLLTAPLLAQVPARQLNGAGWGPFQNITNITVNGARNPQLTLKKDRGCKQIRLAVTGTLRTGMSGDKQLSAVGPGALSPAKFKVTYNSSQLPAGATGTLEYTSSVECLDNCTIVWCTGPGATSLRFIRPGQPVVNLPVTQDVSGQSTLGGKKTDVDFRDENGDRLRYREQNVNGTWPPAFSNFQIDISCSIAHQPVITIEKELDETTSNNGQLGVACSLEEIHVSARGTNATPPHLVYVFDRSTALLRTYQQDPTMSTTPWGWDDGATDHNWGPDLTFFWGGPNGIYLADANGQPKSTYRSGNGIETLPSNVIAGPALATLGVYRGVAYDPNGNGGAGTWWTANWNSDLLEIDSSGTVVDVIPWDGIWSIYGIYRDPFTGHLWINSSPNRGPIVEIDGLGNPTGREIPGAIDIQGGLDGLQSGGTMSRTIGGNDLVAIRQGAPDVLLSYRLSLSDEFNYTEAEDLYVGVDGVADSILGTTVHAFHQTADIRLGQNAGSAGALLLDPAATAGLPQIWAGLLGPTFEYLEWSLHVPLLSPQTISIPFTPGTQLPLDSAALFGLGIPRVSAQAIVLSPEVPGPGLPVYATNYTTIEVGHPNGPARGVQVDAYGANSYNADTSFGFFWINNPSPIAITRMRMTCDGDMLFHVDEVGMGDQFNAGDGTACAGTYRNGSHFAAGLDFFAPGLHPMAACSNGTSSGFRSIGLSHSEFIEFDFVGGLFANGTAFEFDVDTDFGLGINGSSMRGMRFDFWWADGAQSTMFLQPDAVDPNYGFAVH